MTQPPHTIPHAVALPQAGTVLTHEQAAFIAHLAGMHAKDTAETRGSTEPARDALLSSAIPRETTLAKFSIGMMWTMEKVAKILGDRELNELDDFAISYLLYLDPTRLATLTDAGDADAIITAARHVSGPLTVPEAQAAMQHIAREMAFFQKRAEAEDPKKLGGAVAMPPLPSPATTPAAPPDGPSA